MRTKAIETKRYSLRKVKKKNSCKFDNHCSNHNSTVKIPKLLNPKQKEEPLEIPEVLTEERKEPASVSQERQRFSGSTKRKKGKPVKTLEIEEFEKEKNIVKKLKTVTESQKQTDSTTVLEESSNPDDKGEIIEDDVPVYSALYHAVSCSQKDDCEVPKCSIAKQFIAHCTACNKTSERCTICKAMDIMVCKHAQICEVPLEKCCTVPNCDKVRLMVLEEWVTLKHKHNDMMQRVFNGLIHAKSCQDKTCDLLLCKNIKAVLLHTHSCKENENCKTKKFIIQLCEHHQQNCTDVSCAVEFCVENRKRKITSPSCKNESNSMTMAPSHPLKTECKLDNTERVSTSSQLFANTPLPNNNMLIPGMFPWSTSCLSLAHNPPYVMPNNNPVAAFPSFPVSSQMQPTKQNRFPLSRSQEDLGWPNTYTTHMGNSLEINSPPQVIPELPDSQQQVFGETNLPNENMGNIHDIINGTSPTQQMYYQFLNNRAGLPRLSPSELQNILTGQTPTESNLISPFKRSQLNVASSKSTLDENPLPSYNAYTGPEYSNKFDNALLSSAKKMAENVDRINEELKQQDDWAKIDFFKQKLLLEGVDIDTETADETDSNDPSIESEMKSDAMLNNDSFHSKQPLTTIERTFVNLLEDQKAKFQ